MTTIIDGKQVAHKFRQQIATEIQQRLAAGLARPALTTIIVGDNPASAMYVANKHRACQEVGIDSQSIKLSASTSEQELLAAIQQLNADPKVHGILVQLPLPPHINVKNIVTAIDYKKDVDGFHPYNLGLLVQQHPLLRPCTPYGIIQLLKHYQIELIGKNVTIIGTSTIVGRPMMLELLMERATVTICNSKTRNLSDQVNMAEIVIAAVGKPQLIKGEWIKKDTVVIDVGVNHLPDNNIVGDVEFDVARNQASYITPVPGGVGPMTIAMLLRNTLIAAINND